MTKKIFDTIGNTPLIKLENFAGNTPAILLAKQESRNPLGSIKCRLADAMIKTAEQQGLLGPKTTVIEPTSGNTGLGLAFICAAKKIPLVLTMPESMSIERRKILAHLGARLVLTPASEGMSGSLAKARQLADEIPDSFIPDQFSNPVGPQVHAQTTAEEIWRDCDGKIDVFVAGVGTGGTITGCAQTLKKYNPEVRIIAVEPADSPVLSGGKPGPHAIQGIGAGFIPDILDCDLIDEIITVTNEDAIATTKELARIEGLFCGISSGAAGYAAKTIAQNSAKGLRIVFILPDTGERYLSTALFS